DVFFVIHGGVLAPTRAEHHTRQYPYADELAKHARLHLRRTCGRTLRAGPRSEPPAQGFRKRHNVGRDNVLGWRGWASCLRRASRRAWGQVTAEALSCRGGTTRGAPRVGARTSPRASRRRLARTPSPPRRHPPQLPAAGGGRWGSECAC